MKTKFKMYFVLITCMLIIGNNSNAQSTGGTLLNSMGKTTTVKGQSNPYEGTFFQRGKGGQLYVWGSAASCWVGGDFGEIPEADRYSLGLGVEGMFPSSDWTYNVDLSYSKKGFEGWKPEFILMHVGFNYLLLHKPDWLGSFGAEYYMGAMTNKDGANALLKSGPSPVGCGLNMRIQYKRLFMKIGYETDFLTLFERPLKGSQQQFYIRLGFALI